MAHACMDQTSALGMTESALSRTDRGMSHWTGKF